MNDPQIQFDQILETFPHSVRNLLKEIPGHRGILPARLCKEIINILGTQIDDLMVRLLPVAALYAVVPISDFRVGAVAGADTSTEGNAYDLYLGANIEFRGLPLNQSVHAEQAVVMNAWMQGATRVRTIAVSAAPCGYCRQFLNELAGSNTLDIIIPTDEIGGFSQISLSKLLPKAFGPRDLDQETGLMVSKEDDDSLFLRVVVEDKLVLEALSAAMHCYSPYTHNRAGCAIQTADGLTYTGRYAENAAFNPSLSPLQAAVSCMNMGHLSEEKKITRAVLVEKPSGIGQRGVTEMILKSIAPGIELEYYEAEGTTNRH